jgi:hypothetical protein
MTNERHSSQDGGFSTNTARMVFELMTLRANLGTSKTPPLRINVKAALGKARPPLVGSCLVRIAEVADVCGRRARTVRSAVHELEEAGLIVPYSIVRKRGVAFLVFHRPASEKTLSIVCSLVSADVKERWRSVHHGAGVESGAADIGSPLEGSPMNVLRQEEDRRCHGNIECPLEGASHV